MQENNFHVNEHSLRTTISNVEPNKLTTRGFNQQDLIEKILKQAALWRTENK